MQWLRRIIEEKFPGVAFEVTAPPDPAMGDYSTNLAFALAKERGKHPRDAAQEIADAFRDFEFFEKVEIAGPGFVNFYLKKEFLQGRLKEIFAARASYGSGDSGKDRTVIVEYSQPNIAKKMHIGHLRTTVLGDALANAYDALGWKVIRWNYIGDWGTQFGKLIAAYKLWGNKEDVEQNPIESLLALYVRFHEEMKASPDLELKGQEEFRKLEAGDLENQQLWQWFRRESLKEFHATYRVLGVTFDVEIGESFYEKELPGLIAELLDRNIAEPGEGGAIIVKLDRFGLPPAIVRKSDGASVYLTRDLANIRYRLHQFHPTKILYVVGNEQSLHFEQVFAIAQVMGMDQAVLEHVKYGLVLDEGGKKFATREGRVVFLEEVIAKAKELARTVVAEKNPRLSAQERDTIAQAVAVGALKYAMLKDHRNSDITFNWKAMLDLSGDSGPYLQYTYARLANIGAKAGWRWFRRPDVSLLDHELELRLIRRLMDFPDVVEKAAEQYALNGVALYLYQLASLASRYYEEVRILADPNKKRRDARLMLIETVAAVLGRGLTLLGITPLKRI